MTEMCVLINVKNIRKKDDDSQIFRYVNDLKSKSNHYITEMTAFSIIMDGCKNKENVLMVEKSVKNKNVITATFVKK